MIPILSNLDRYPDRLPMDLRTAARVKANARLQPAKDISVSYSELLANTNPDKFLEIRAKLILSIDAAEAEYQILRNQITVIADVIHSWDREIQFCRTDVQNLQTEMNALDAEREEIEERVRTISHLEALKQHLMRANIEGMRTERERIVRENADMQKDIEAIEASNEKRSAALTEVIAGFEKFLLKERPSGIVAEAEG
jgi:chromosome segregation ATPase